MTSDMFGTDTVVEEAIPEPPAPEGPGLFGFDEPAAAAPQPAAPMPTATATMPRAPSGTAASPPPPATPYRVLARKYRPSTFAELIGQDALVRTLRNAFATNRVAHAFMLTGVRGVGKTTTARIIARALNCIGPDGTGGPTAEPCGICPNCTAILADRHPDVMELDAASNNGVDDVRELREAVRYRPAQARFKIYILDEVHMLSSAAFNALLKTLEEPPPAVKFLFATTELRKVPPTILSRCQTFHLARVPQETLRAHYGRICGLEGVTAEDEALAMIARAADGSVRDGLSLLDQAIALAGDQLRAETVRDMLGLADRTLVLDALEAALAGETAALLDHLDRAHERGAEPGVLLSDMLDLVHTLTRLHSVPALAQDQSLPEHERVRGAALAQRLTIPILGRAWQILLKGVAEVNDAPDRRAALDMVLIRLAHLADLPPPGELVRRLTEAGAAQRGASVPAGHASGGPSAGPADAGASGSANGAFPASLAGGPSVAPQVGRLAASSHLSGGSVPGGAAQPPNGGLRAVAGLAGGGTLAMAPAAQHAPDPAAPPLPTTWQDVVALAAASDPMLHAQLRHDVHPVSLSPGRIDIRPSARAPRDLAGKLSLLLERATGTRWVIGISREAGAPTLDEQGRSAAADRLTQARAHPLVQAVLAAFPGAQLREVRDEAADMYGLSRPASLAAPAGSLAAPAGALAEPASLPDFAPPDAEPMLNPDDEPLED